MSGEDQPDPISSRLRRQVARLGGLAAAAELGERLRPHGPPPTRFRVRRGADATGVADWWAGRDDAVRDALAGPETLAGAARYGANIENMIGTVALPVGVVGPLRVNGLHAAGDYLVPLATTEAALVASYARGADVMTRAGGAAAALLSEGVVRSPAFVFASVVEAGSFVAWVAEQGPALREAAEATTRHGRLEAIEPFVDNDTVFVVCRYTTGDAAGQNMVTIATEAMCRAIVANCPIRPRHWFVEGNFSGDKKASYLGLLIGRGRKVSASVTIPDALVERCLRVDVDRMLAYARVAQLGAMLSGQIGAQGHYANGLAALYLATGQDAACVAESAVGFTRMERRDDGLFMSVTLPNLLVGSVGGGTGLPAQNACLSLMGLAGGGKAAALAEVTASLCLAGEISIMAAIAAGEFTRAHHRLARRR
ncbi:3-hydroxy-3-methylglutaryl-CoA reductase [Sphingomonas sp. Leaf231]|uniref:hydroxymethylglutaryl-CoA reductase n=1 Tax=Sphingomonas sp. Leaf231 TaxID=1736301 RepID=UPI0006F80D0E|nr:hydroxymethylglutaryl-CoA reductase [Sphingomonas sp. Leaf231]KQN90114.1 3-hydroxy-3-methylglutaryl-CoA reductase [Sphingomonas sp. Leaf231]